MSIKKEKWKPVMEILFTYLAISKILYWYNNVTAMGQGDILGAAEAFLIRFVQNDLIMIVSVIFFYFLYKLVALKTSKERTVLNGIIESTIFYAIGYVFLIVISTIYSIVLATIEGTPWQFSWSAYINFIGYTLPSYLVIIAVLTIKEYFKKKGKEIAEDETDSQSKDKKLFMLKTLLNDGVLTQEEFNEKKEKVLGM